MPGAMTPMEREDHIMRLMFRDYERLDCSEEPEDDDQEHQSTMEELPEEMMVYCSMVELYQEWIVSNEC